MMRSRFRMAVIGLLGTGAVLALLAPALVLASDAEPPEHETLVVIGAPGEESYAKGFKAAAEAWKEAADSTRASFHLVGLRDSEETDKDQIKAWIENRDNDSAAPVWIVYIGHGTHTAKRTLLNLRGPDLDAETLAAWLDPVQRTLIFIHGGSASAPFINHLSKPNRILITATQSGDELNYARFGERFANIIESRSGDSNEDGQVSLLEAFVATSRSVEQFYKGSNRLASEHALIDDNGDAIGTPSDWFRGERLVKEPEDGQAADGFRSRQIAFIPSPQESLLTPAQRFARDQLEAKLEALRAQKDELDEDDYYERLESVLLELGAIYLDGVEDS